MSEPKLEHLVRFLRMGPAPHTAEDCLAHRCDAHASVPPVNQAGPQAAECAICVGHAFVLAYERGFEEQIFWPVVRAAAQRLDLVVPGAGATLLEEAHAALDPATRGTPAETEVIPIVVDPDKPHSVN